MPPVERVDVRERTGSLGAALTQTAQLAAAPTTPAIRFAGAPGLAPPILAMAEPELRAYAGNVGKAQRAGAEALKRWGQKR